MTKLVWASTLAHTSDATFRAWGSELAGKLVAAGLTQSADTGQINWSTVTRAGTSTNAGYEIYYLTGSLHATAPIYIKIYYGTGSSATLPRIQVEVGPSTDGAGNVTGTAKTGVLSISNTSAVPSSNGASYLCVTSDFFGLIFKAGGGAVPSPLPSFTSLMVMRSCDSTGAATATGAFVVTGGTASTNGSLTGIPSSVSLRFPATAKAYTSVNAQGIALSGEVGSGLLTSALPRVVRLWMLTPQVMPVFGACAVILREVIGIGTTFTAKLVGTSTRTYLALGSEMGAAAIHPTNVFGMAMLWE